jgi:hypothetical protein
MSLPEARSSSQPPTNTSSGGFRPVGSANRARHDDEQASEPSVAPARTTRSPRSAPTLFESSSSKYSYDRNYGRLSGQLEHSRAEDRWKLRYIPIDGDTDEYGGSVVLSGDGVLDGFKAGEYVTVTGSIEQAGSGSRSFAPNYRVDQVERQGQ